MQSKTANESTTFYILFQHKVGPMSDVSARFLVQVPTMKKFSHKSNQISSRRRPFRLSRKCRQRTARFRLLSCPTSTPIVWHSKEKLNSSLLIQISSTFHQNFKSYFALQLNRVEAVRHISRRFRSQR